MTEYIKVGSDRPDFTTTLLDTDDDPVELTDASNVAFLMWGPDANLLVSGSAEIVDALGGEVRYDFDRDEVAAVGTNVAEVRVDWDDGDKQWFPIDRRAYEIEVTRSPADRSANLSNVSPTQSAEVQDLTVNGTVDDPDGTLNVGSNLSVTGDLSVAGAISIDEQNLADGEAITYGTDGDFETTYENGPDAWLVRDLLNAQVAFSVARANDGTNINVDGGTSLYDATGPRIGPDLVDETSLDAAATPTWTAQHTFNGGVELGSDVTASGTTVWDESEGHITQEAIEPGGDTVTVESGDGLKGGGPVSHGELITLDIEPSDFAGAGLADDGNDNLRVAEDGVQSGMLAPSSVDTAAIGNDAVGSSELTNDPIEFQGDISTPSVNSVAYCKQSETLNDVMSRTSGDVKIVLPPGITTYTTNLQTTRTVVVQGQGRSVSRLRSDGPGILFFSSTDAPDSDLVFSDLTLDANHDDPEGRIVELSAQRDNVQLHNVDLVNLDNSGLADQNQAAFIFGGGGIVSAKRFLVTGNSRILLNTIQNRSTSNNYNIAKCNGSNTVGSVVVGPAVEHFGTVATGSEEEIRGYDVTVEDYAMIDGLFTEWDQYATWATGATDDSVIDIRATARNCGDGDIFRAGMAVEGGAIYLRGSVVGTANEGDRGFIVQTGAQPGLVHVDIDVRNTRVPLSIRGGKVVNIVGFSAVNSGGTSGTGDSREALQISDKDTPIGSVVASVNIFNDGSRLLDPAIRLIEENDGWNHSTHVFRGTINGHETTQLDTSALSADPTIETSQLF